MLLDSRLLFAASYFLSTHLIFLEPEGRPKGGAEMGVERVTEATSEDDERENDATSDTTPTPYTCLSPSVRPGPLRVLRPSPAVRTRRKEWPRERQ